MEKFLLIVEKNNQILNFVISSESPKEAIYIAFEKLAKDSKKAFASGIKGRIGKSVIREFEFLSGYKILIFSILPKIIFYNSENLKVVHEESL